jgi:hypothetical protein
MEANSSLLLSMTFYFYSRYTMFLHIALTVTLDTFLKLFGDYYHPIFYMSPVVFLSSTALS